MKNMKVLFVCEGNIMRSQMAEAFYRALGGSGEVISAGSAAAQKDHIAERADVCVLNRAGEGLELPANGQVLEVESESDCFHSESPGCVVELGRVRWR